MRELCRAAWFEEKALPCRSPPGTGDREPGIRGNRFGHPVSCYTGGKQATAATNTYDISASCG